MHRLVRCETCCGGGLQCAAGAALYVSGVPGTGGLGSLELSGCPAVCLILREVVSHVEHSCGAPRFAAKSQPTCPLSTAPVLQSHLSAAGQAFAVHQ